MPFDEALTSEVDMERVNLWGLVLFCGIVSAMGAVLPLFLVTTDVVLKVVLK